MATAVTGVDQRASRALVKYLWEAWDGVTRRVRFNCMARFDGGCVLRVWYLVRLAMGLSRAVAVGCTIGGGGAGKIVWMCTRGSGSHGTFLLGTL